MTPTSSHGKMVSFEPDLNQSSALPTELLKDAAVSDDIELLWCHQFITAIDCGCVQNRPLLPTKGTTRHFWNDVWMFKGHYPTMHHEI